MALKVKKQKDKSSKDTPKFLKTGKAKKRLLRNEETKSKLREEQKDKLWRFRIPEEKLQDDFKITFLDGDLDEDGNLENPVFYEHSLKHNGRWINFVSCCEDEADPLQEEGKEPYLAQVFTVINHTPYESRDGKIYKNQKQLLVAKRQTMKILQKLATKRRGLRGCTFEVSRTSDKSPSVGDTWTFTKKRATKDLMRYLVEKKKVKQKEVEALVQPADYNKELTYYSRKECIKMGFAEKRETISTKGGKNYDDLDDEL